MASGNPNDKSKLLNFVAKVYDPVAKTYKPIYELPDATDQVYGGVRLSDATDSTSSAATGVTAASPAAVNAVRGLANNKLDKTQTGTQTVASAVTFAGKVTGQNGFTGDLTGNVTGNADTVTKLATARSIGVRVGTDGASGSANFDGSGNVTITVPSVPSSHLIGTIPLNLIPQGALERMIHVANQAARFALTSSQVQLGDTVIQDDTKIMYIVVDESKLNQAAGYQEYSAGTASEAKHATSADTATKANSADKATSATTADTANKTKGTLTFNILTGNTVEGMLSNEDSFNGSVDKKFTLNNFEYKNMVGASTTAAGKAGLAPAPAAGTANRFLRSDGTWATVQSGVTGVKGSSETDYRTGNVNITAANVGALSLAGGTLTGTLNSRAIVPTANNSYSLGTSSMLWSNIYATNFHGSLQGNASTATTASSATTAANVTNVASSVAISGAVTGSGVSINGTTGAKTISTTLSDNTVTTSKLASGAVTSAKIADNTITNKNLADEVGTVYIGTSEPTESHVKIWVKI